MSIYTQLYPRRILFVCSGNTCRSQIAEAWARYLGNDTLRVASAGVQPRELDPQAVAVMAEVGIDLTPHRPKALTVYPDLAFDLIVTLSLRATEFVHKQAQHPPVLAFPCASPENRRTPDPQDAYRQIRDELYRFIEQTLHTWQAVRLPHPTPTR